MVFHIFIAPGFKVIGQKNDLVVDFFVPKL